MFKALYPRTIWLIFLSLSAIFLSLGYFKFWAPNQEETKMNVDQANSLYQEANKLQQAVKKKNGAIETIRSAEAGWIPFVANNTPSRNTADNGMNINVNHLQLLLDSKRFRNSMQIAVNRQLHAGGVKAIQGPRVPGVTDQDDPNTILAGYYNYPGVPFPVVIHDLGQVQVQGTYEQILAHVRSWENIPHYLAVTHGLQFQGTAPLLTATYNLTLVAYIRYDGMYGEIPVQGGTANTGGSAGGGPAAQGGGPGANAPRGGPGGPGPGAPRGPQRAGTAGN